MKKKIDFNLENVENTKEEALYYIFCLLESICLNVDLKKCKDKKEIRTFYESQKRKLVENGAIITYNGPNFLDFGKKEIKYVLNLDSIIYKKGNPLNFIVRCFYGTEYHKDIGSDKGLSTEILEKNGTKFCNYLYGGSVKNRKFFETAIVLNIIWKHMPRGFHDLGEIINFIILNNFGMM